jgi:hypothetical protein
MFGLNLLSSPSGSYCTWLLVLPTGFCSFHFKNKSGNAALVNSGIMCAELATAYEDEKALGIANEEDEVFFERLYPRLETWFQWFNTSQTGTL